MNAAINPAARPRLTPGIPAGGVAALAVTLAVVAAASIFGDSPRTAFVDVGGGSIGVKLDGFQPPRPPVPPIPGAPPMPPLPPGVMIDHAEIARTVEQAMRGVDWVAVERAVKEAGGSLDRADIEALRATAREAAEAARQEAEGLREQARTLRERTGAAATGTGAPAADAAASGGLAANFDARALRLVNVSGDIAVEVSGRSDIRLEVDANAGNLRTSVADGRLTIVGAGDQGGSVDIRLIVPEGADLAFAGQTGDISISGRRVGALSLDMIRGDVSAEKVDSADIKVLQASDVSIGQVDGTLRYALFGAGDLSVEQARDAVIDVSGAGAVSLSRVNGLTLSIPGQADVSVERVDGPVNTAFLGAGTVHIAGGEATPLKVAVIGSGEFTFDGTARDPVVLADGMGSVRVARHTGKANVQNRGQGTAWVGD